MSIMANLLFQKDWIGRFSNPQGLEHHCFMVTEFWGVSAWWLLSLKKTFTLIILFWLTNLWGIEEGYFPFTRWGNGLNDVANLMVKLGFWDSWLGTKTIRLILPCRRKWNWLLLVKRGHWILLQIKPEGIRLVSTLQRLGVNTAMTFLILALKWEHSSFHEIRDWSLES